MLRETALLSKLVSAWPPERWHDVTVLIAVSGGADSVALARGLHQLAGSAGRLVIAHFNHRLRGAESDADESFVRDLGNQLGLRVMFGNAASDLSAAGSGEGVEGAARKARYEFFSAAAGECGARYLVTAHTADDQSETVLFNILRGTGLAGLAGIPRLRELTVATTIIRPLLDITRSDVLDYLQSIGQSYRDDSSNRLEDYTRNRIRLQLLPQLARDYNPRVREALVRVAQISTQTKNFLDQQAEAVLGVAARRIPGGIELDHQRLNSLDPALARHILLFAWQQQGWPQQDMSFEKWQNLIDWCQSSSVVTPRVQILPGGVRAELAANCLRLIADAPKT